MTEKTDKKIVIGLMGTIGSGKTYFAEYLIEKYGFYKVSMGDLIRETADKLKIERTRENLQKVGNKYRDKYGKDYWIKEVLKRIEKSDNNRIIIDGVRTPIEARFFKKHSFLVFVDAKPEIRYKRIIDRARENEENKTIEDVRKQEEGEFKVLKTNESYKYAEYKILNNSTKEEFDNSIKKFLSDLIE
jgi:dephospho-CoA kinase